MNILIFNWRDLKHSWAGGGEIYVFELAKRWVKMGNSVTVFCSQDKERGLPDTETNGGIKIVRKGSRYSVYLWAFWYYIRNFRNKYDFVVDVENGVPFFTPLFSRLPKISLVYHIHGKQFFYELPFPVNYLGYIVEKYLFPLLYRNTHVIAISKTTRQELKNLGFSGKNISIVYCGVNGSTKNNNLLVNKFTNPTLLYLGRIKAYKRVDMLLDIFSELLKEFPNLRLVIAGWGTEASYITDLVMKSHYRRKIELMGPVNEVEKKRLLQKSWVFINPSIGEGWSIAVIEANYYGTPAVAFNVPGLSESIRHGETGFLAKDKKEMVKILEKFINNKNSRDKLSKNALKWSQSFSWDKAAQKSILIMQRVKKR